MEVRGELARPALMSYLIEDCALAPLDGRRTEFYFNRCHGEIIEIDKNGCFTLYGPPWRRKAADAGC